VVDQDDRAARLFRVLAHPRRLEMIWLLADGELNVGQLAQQLGVRQPNVSQQLAQLREAGLVTSQRNGHSVTNWLTTPGIVAVMSLSYELAAELDRSDRRTR
jgi:DNA-binding transcriptional ArsR family regulator